MQYWLFKSEKECFSWQDLLQSPNQTTAWDGVRNYQARNFMRTMQLGDQGFFYHSGKKPEIAGIVQIVRTAYPDHTAWDNASEHFDPRSTNERPLWDMVDVCAIQSFTPPILRSDLKIEVELAGMELMKKGSRLSVQIVTEQEFKHIVALC